MSVRPCLPLYQQLVDAVPAASAAARLAAQAAFTFGVSGGLLSREAVAHLEGSLQEAIYSVDVTVAGLAELAACYDAQGHPASAEKMRRAMQLLQAERAGLTVLRDRLLPLLR